MSAGSAWTTIEDALLVNNPHLSSADLSTRLQRSQTSVHQRRTKLRKTGALQVGGLLSPVKVGARPLLAKTCPECGRLLQAMWFSAGKQRTRVCTRCRESARDRSRSYSPLVAHQNRASFLERQAMTLPGASRAREPWTEADFTVLQDPDLSILQKALMLHRTYAATTHACQRNGFDSHVGLGDPDKDQWVIDNPNVDKIRKPAVKVGR